MYISLSQVEGMLDSIHRILQSLEAVNEASIKVKETLPVTIEISGAFDENLLKINEELTAQRNLLKSITDKDDLTDEIDACAPIENLNLSRRELNVLKRNNINFISSLETFLQFHSPFALKGCGMVSAENIEREMEKYQEERKKKIEEKKENVKWKENEI